MAETREQTADRLLRSSARVSYDPVVEIDWAAPLDPDAFWLPPHRSSLYGTALWERLDHRQRVELTKHEVASGASAGIWFETILMQMLVREYYRQDPTSRHAQYALTEVADECRHSVMFGRMIETMGCPVYPANPLEQVLGGFLKATARGPHMYAAILLAEEILDAFQREIMVDATLQPLIRAVAHIHVVEEARHVAYARAELARQVAAAGPARLAYARLVTARAAYSVANRLVHPRVYAAVGIRPRDGVAAARANPHWQGTLRWAAGKARAYLDELGMLSGPGRRLWRRAHLI
ncbi:MAG: diiron oxygenase [Micromonosporaceae bacterium]|nr:diiron oxygenase [Micromonosporaceae bacterium]